jgi:hypothetical protein
LRKHLIIYSDSYHRFVYWCNRSKLYYYRSPFFIYVRKGDVMKLQGIDRSTPVLLMGAYFLREDYQDIGDFLKHRFYNIFEADKMTPEEIKLLMEDYYE